MHTRWLFPCTDIIQQAFELLVDKTPDRSQPEPGAFKFAMSLLRELRDSNAGLELDQRVWTSFLKLYDSCPSLCLLFASFPHVLRVVFGCMVPSPSSCPTFPTFPLMHFASFWRRGVERSRFCPLSR